MPRHRDRRATPLCAKIRPPRSGRSQRAAGLRRLLARSPATRLRCAPCQRLSASDPGRSGI